MNANKIKEIHMIVPKYVKAKAVVINTNRIIGWKFMPALSSK